MDKVKKILNVEENNDNLEYYYFDFKKYCCDIDLPPTFDNIDIYNFVEPIKLMSEYYTEEPNYYREVYENVKDKKFNDTIFLKDFDEDNHMDEMLLQYIKTQKHSVGMLIWPIADIDSISELKESKFYAELEKNGKIHIVKEINISKKQVQGMIYQLYPEKPGFKNFGAIKGKQDCGDAANTKNKFFVIIYKPNNFKEISGTDAPLKVTLRKLLMDNNLTPQINCDLKPNYFLHVTDNHTGLIEFAQLFFNKNSIRLLQYQRLDRLLYGDYAKSLLMFMTFKNWLYKNIHPVDHERFMLFSSVVLFSMGIRNMNDIDAIVYNMSDNKNKTENFDAVVDQYLIKNDSRFKFFDTHIKRNNIWYENETPREYMAEWFDNEWASMYKSRSMYDTVVNSKHHYYFFGIKIISMQADIFRRMKRSRPAAYADLIAIMEFTHQCFKIPKFPDGYWKEHKYYKYDQKEKFICFKKIKWYLHKRYNIHYDIDKISNIVNC